MRRWRSDPSQLHLLGHLIPSTQTSASRSTPNACASWTSRLEATPPRGFTMARRPCATDRLTHRSAPPRPTASKSTFRSNDRRTASRSRGRCYDGIGGVHLEGLRKGEDRRVLRRRQSLPQGLLDACLLVTGSTQLMLPPFDITGRCVPRRDTFPGDLGHLEPVPRFDTREDQNVQSVPFRRCAAAVLLVVTQIRAVTLPVTPEAAPVLAVTVPVHWYSSDFFGHALFASRTWV